MRYLFIVLLFVSSVAFAQQKVFHISRSLNGNLVRYDVNLNNGKIDTKEPLYVYWDNVADNPKNTKELSFLQKKMAYGYTVISASANEVVIKLKAYKDRSAKLCKQNGKWVAIITINGKDCQLKEIYAHCPTRTSCDYIDLIGINKEGKSEKEHIKN